MKKTLILTAILFICALLLANEPVAVSLKVQGEVELKRSEKLQKAKTGDQLQNNDQLESRDDSYAAIKFIDGSSVVKLFPNSILKIQANKENNELAKKSYLQVGNMWSNVMKKTGAFEIETPTTVVSVKGTKFLLEVSETGATNVFTFDGEVEITNKKDGKRATVKPGQKGTNNGNVMEVSTTEKADIKPEIMKNIEEDMNMLKFEVENDEGETKTIEIQFE
jgi:hypothetical protein